MLNDIKALKTKISKLKLSKYLFDNYVRKEKLF